MYGMTANEQREANYRKNRGDPGQWFQHKADYRSPRPNPRVTAQAAATAEKYQACESRQVVHNYRLPADDEPAPVRLRDEDGRRNADKFINQDDKWFDFDGNQRYQPDPRPPRLGPGKAQELKEVNEQQRSSDWYGHRSDPKDTEPPPKPRCPSSKSVENKERIRNNKVEWKEHPTKAPDPNEYQGPTGPIRTKPQGMEYALRSRGTGKDWMEHHTVKDEQSTNEGGPYRCNTRQAAENWQRSRGTAMRDCFDYTTGYKDPQPPPKAHGVAEEYLHRNQQGSSSLWKNKEGAVEDADSRMPAGRTRPEAQAIANKNAGSLGMWMDQGKNRDYSSPRPQPRLPSGVAQKAADRNKGCMDEVIDRGEYPQAVYKKPIQPRGGGTEVAKAVAEANRGVAAMSVMTHSDLPPEAPPRGRIVSSAAEDNAQRNKGSIGSLFTQYGQMGPEDKPQPRLRPEAKGNADRCRGDDFFKVIQQAPP